MKKIFDYLLFLSFKLIKLLLSFFPRQFCLFLGRKLGFIFYLFDKRRRHIAVSNLSSALGNNLSPDSLKSIARRSFSHFGEVLMDIIKFSTLKEQNKSRLIEIEGMEHIQNALLEKKGVLLFSGHFGNWEIAPHVISRLGPLKVMARPLDNVFLEKELYHMRLKLGEEVIYKHNAAREVLRALRENNMVAILIDQNVLDSEAVFVDFFGKAAATTPGLATFHLRTQAPLVPVFSTPTSAHTFSIKILPPVKVSLSGEYNQDVLKITQICTKIIEDQIRDNPKFWLWFHNRWKTRPESKTRSARSINPSK
ncbi:lysophospholipid acyltransferase family protein [Acidobacteriota bacterium]